MGRWGAEVRAVDSEISVFSDLPVPGRSPQNVILQLLRGKEEEEEEEEEGG